MAVVETPAATPTVMVYAPRERTRSQIRETFPRRRTRVVFARNVNDFTAGFRRELIDAAIVDVTSADEDTWRVAVLAREFPSVPFFGLASLRAAEGHALAQCADYEF